jgi:hypothetical protein
MYLGVEYITLINNMFTSKFVFPSRWEHLKSKKTWSTDIKSNFLLVNVGSNLLLGVFLYYRVMDEITSK